MDRLIRISFTLLKISSLGLIVIYLLMVVLVGASGHNVGNNEDLMMISGYALLLYLLLARYQRSVKEGSTVRSFLKVLLFVFILPAVTICGLYLYGFLTSPLSDPEVWISIFFLLAYIFPGVLVLYHLTGSGKK